MEDKTLIAKITIPQYIRSIEISKAQREKYYEWDGITIKSGRKKLLQKYINKYCKKDIIFNNGNVEPQHLNNDYIIIGFKGKDIYEKIYQTTTTNGVIKSRIGKSKWTKKQLELPTKYFLCYDDIDENYPKVIANETQAGKPRNHIIKGQDFYVGLNPHIRNKIVTALKESYYEVLKLVNGTALVRLRYKLKTSYPIIIEMEIQDTITNVFGKQPKDESNPGTRWDVGNRADPYLKTFLDFLVEGFRNDEGIQYFQPLIVDDDRLHISGGNNAYFTPIEDESKRKLVFHIYKDDRTVWKKWFEKYKQYIKT